MHRGRITKQGSTLIRWAAVEAVQGIRTGPIGSTRSASVNAFHQSDTVDEVVVSDDLLV